MKYVITLILCIFITTIYGQSMERTYSDTLFVIPDQFHINLNFVNDKFGELTLDLPIKLLTLKQVESKLKEYKNVKFRLLESLSFEDSMKTYMTIYELIVDNNENYKMIKEDILKSSIHTIANFEKDRLNQIESEFIRRMNSENKIRFSKEFNLTTDEVSLIKIEDMSDIKKSSHTNNINDFSVLKEKHIASSLGKYYCQIDGSYACIRTIRLLFEKE